MAECENCGRPIDENERGELQNHGEVLVVGGYASFHDPIDLWPHLYPFGQLDPDTGEEIEGTREHAQLEFLGRLSMLFCHNCLAALWDAFPAFRKKYGDSGLHPYDGEPCCNYGWT